MIDREALRGLPAATGAPLGNDSARQHRSQANPTPAENQTDARKRLQVAHLTRRFGLPLPTAGLVAALHFGEAS
jgi:hypothetical protein